MVRRPGSIGSAALWMFGLSILLFWLPILGPVMAGFIGGRKAGTMGNALIAALLPAIVFGVGLFLLASGLTGFPLFGFIAAAGGFAVAAAHVIPLVGGAVAGALL